VQTTSWKFIQEQERTLGHRFLDGLPEAWTLHGPQTMDGRVSTFAITHAVERPEAAAERLAEAGFAVWHGNYYALEVMKRLGLSDGAIRVGIVHYNTEDEVDRLASALSDLT
jgi:selenocysteine lyase/cysteine desulfurase